MTHNQQRGVIILFLSFVIYSICVYQIGKHVADKWYGQNLYIVPATGEMCWSTVYGVKWPARQSNHGELVCYTDDMPKVKP